MAIFSADVRSIGKTTQKAPFTVCAALRYIARPKACSEMLSENLPPPGVGATRLTEAWFRREEKADRANARIADRFILALPVELTHAQNADLVRAFMAELGGNLIPWAAGIHDLPKDAHNPHVHILVRDRGRDTGRRVIGMTDKGAVMKVRALWSKVANEALRAVGSTERIDHRSYAEQGINRIPGVHEGAARHSPEPEGEESRMNINARIAQANQAMEQAEAVRAAQVADLRQRAKDLEAENAAMRQALADLRAKGRAYIDKVVAEIHDLLDDLARVREPTKRPAWLDPKRWSSLIGHVRQVKRLLGGGNASGGIERRDHTRKRDAAAR